MKTLRFDWTGNPIPALPNELVLTRDPLAEKPYAWFEDYFDYKNEFIPVYNAAKSKSTTWTDEACFQTVEILGVPYLAAFEHWVHSFWNQVERDNRLINNLLEKEILEIIVLSDVQPDPDKIILGLFDPGLFEFTLRSIAEKKRLSVTTSSNKNNISDVDTRRSTNKNNPGWIIKIIGAISAQIQAVIYRQYPDKRKKSILVSSEVFARIKDQFLTAAEKCNSAIVSTELDRCKMVPTIWTIYGIRISVFQRLRLYKKTLASFNSIPKSSWSRAFTKDNIDYGPIARESLHCGLNKYLWPECYRLLLLDAAIKDLHPASLLVLYDHGITEACSVALAKKHSVRTVTLQHGKINRQIHGYFPVRTDYFACWGEREKEALIIQKIEPEKIVITGYPAFEKQIENANRFDAISDEKHHPLNVLFVTQAGASAVEWYFAYIPTVRIIKEIVAVNLAKEKYRITFRLHPNEMVSDATRELAGKAGVELTKGLPLEKQLAETDIVVFHFSTVGFEALLAGKPLVTVNWVNDEEVVPFSASGVAARSRSPQDFPEALERAIDPELLLKSKRVQFIKEYLGEAGATERLMDLLLLK